MGKISLIQESEVTSRGWKGSSAVKITSCSYKRAEFNFPMFTMSGSQPPVTPED